MSDDPLVPSARAAVDRLAYSITEAAHVSSLSKTGIYRLIAAGKIRTKVVGSRRLVIASSLREFLEQEDAA